MSAQLESCLKHLENLGLDQNIEDKLVRFENTITKIIQFRARFAFLFEIFKFIQMLSS